MKTTTQLLAVSATFVMGGFATLIPVTPEPGARLAPHVPAAATISHAPSLPAAVPALGPGYKAIYDNYIAVIVDAAGRFEYNQASVAEVSAMTKAIDPSGLKTTASEVRTACGIPASGDFLSFIVHDSDPSTGWDVEGNVIAIAQLDLHYSSASMWELCEQVPEACEIAQIAEDAFPDLVQGTYSARLGSATTVGLFGQASVEGVPTTVLMPYYVIPDGAQLGGWQYAEFLLGFKDQLDPFDLEFLWAGGTDMVIGTTPEDPCLTQAVQDCITRELGDLMQALQRLERDYKRDYNNILDAAQRAARRCSPIHSVGGFLRTLLTLGIEPVLEACAIWEEFDADVNALNAQYRTDICDAYKDARDEIMDCLGDCPLWLRQALLAMMNQALADMGC